MIRIGSVLILVHIIHLEVSADFSTCAMNIQTSAKMGEHTCLMKKLNAPDCIMGYTVAISNIPHLCSSSGAGRKRRSKYDKAHTTQICISSSSLSVPTAFVFILHILDIKFASLENTYISWAEQLLSLAIQPTMANKNVSTAIHSSLVLIVCTSRIEIDITNDHL